ncbi:MAG: MBL fold metallo-hydrolase [Candidatus Thorarchaeota archaeon]
MKVTLLGTGTSVPDPERVQSGIMIECRGQLTLFDIGSGVLHRLMQAGIDFRSINGIFISHFHIDHCSDFITLIQTLWLEGYESKLPVYGPPPLTDFIRGLFEVALPFYRDKVILDPIILKERDAVHCGDLSVSSCSTLHSKHDTRAFRVEHKKRSMVYSSDTAFCRDVVDLAKDTDLLIHECNWLDGPHPEGVHSAPSDVMRVAEESNPKKVVVTHMMPEVAREKGKVLSTVRRRTEADVSLGRDLLEINL